MSDRAPKENRARSRRSPSGTARDRQRSRSHPAAELHATAGNAAVASVFECGDRPSGRPLEPALRRRLEAYFGRDLATVRIHDDERAEGATASLGTAAYNAGDDIVVSRSQLDLRSPRGEHVLAHEVAHVVQRRLGQLPEDGRVTVPTDPVEPAAERAAIGFTNTSQQD